MIRVLPGSDDYRCASLNISDRPVDWWHRDSLVSEEAINSLPTSAIGARDTRCARRNGFTALKSGPSE